jgi:quinol-cytochrome oxidoreductase complex cytochrome b subunit
MPHVVVAPLIIGSVLTVGGVLVLVFHRWVLKRVPERSSNWDCRRYVRNTPLYTIIFGAIVVVFGLLTLLGGGLQLL